MPKTGRPRSNQKHQMIETFAHMSPADQDVMMGMFTAIRELGLKPTARKTEDPLHVSAAHLPETVSAKG